MNWLIILALIMVFFGVLAFFQFRPIRWLFNLGRKHGRRRTKPITIGVDLATLPDYTRYIRARYTTMSDGHTRMSIESIDDGNQVQ